MAWKRAVLFAIALYAITFLVGILISIYFDLDPENPEVPLAFWYAQLGVSVVLASLATFLYFNKDGINRGLKNGLLFGITLILTGFFLDMIIAIPALIGGSVDLLIEYYKQPIFWVTLAGIVFAATTTGALLPPRKPKIQ